MNEVISNVTQGNGELDRRSEQTDSCKFVRDEPAWYSYHSKDIRTDQTQSEHTMSNMLTNISHSPIFYSKDHCLFLVLNGISYSTHTVHIQYTYSTHTVHIQYTYSTHTVHIQYTDSTHTVHIQYTYSTHTVHIQYTYSTHTVHIQYTYSTHTVHIQYTYSTHTVHIQYTYSTHTCTCSMSTIAQMGICNLTHVQGETRQTGLLNLHHILTAHEPMALYLLYVQYALMSVHTHM